jgi:hypothetical protein
MTKFTPENRGGLIERTAAGVSLADASRDLGLRLPTVKGWLTRGRRESSGPYTEFVAAIERARQEAADRPGPMTRDELRLRVSEAARKGSVQAMKLMNELLRGDEIDAMNARGADPFAEMMGETE